MDYYLLTDLAARVGYHLALSGAETFRVEETIRRIIGAYGIECEAFSIPNCVMVSLEAANGKPLMVMKRVGFHGNDLESVEKLNALSRRICAETPDPSVAAQWLDETLKGRRHYSVPVYYLGNFCAAAGFCPVFGGTLRDSLFAGLLGLIIGFVSRQMDRRETNPFFSTIVEAFAMAVPAYLAAGFHLVDYIDFVIIGTLMILVPGLLITTSMRDIIYGDTNSGINRIVQVLLSAFAIALGTAAAWRVTSGVYGLTVASGSASYPAWAQAVMIFVACTGFFILFNVHDWGSILCALGGVFTWMTYLLCRDLGMSIYSMNFFAAVVSALYSELMARSRKYPVTSYLVISLLPLVPGAGIYYTMSPAWAAMCRPRCTKDLRPRASRAASPWRSCWCPRFSASSPRRTGKAESSVRKEKTAAQTGGSFLLQCVNVSVQRGKIAAGIGVQVAVFRVDETVGQKKHIHPDLARGHVLGRVVADHQALLRLDAERARDLEVVSRIRLAEGRGLVGRVNFKILRHKARPADAVLRRHVGKDWIRRQRNAVAALFELMDRLHRRGIKAADVARGVELIGVEILEKALVALALFLAVDRRELLPEGLLVRAAAVVFDHSRRARPDGVDEGFGLVAVGRELFGKELKVSGRERLLIHRQQRSVQIK